MALSDAERDLIAAVDEGRRNPVQWLRDAFASNPWERQRQIIESVRDNRITAVKSCHGAGKSWTAAQVVEWFTLNHYMSKTVTTAPTFRQVENILWAEIRSTMARAVKPFRNRPLTTEWRLDANWFALGMSADNADSFQGIHAPYVLVVVDEASGVNEEIWKGVRALLTGGYVRLLAIGNPTDGSSYFASFFKRGDVSKITITAFDTPNFTELGITLDDIRTGEWRAKQLAYVVERGDLPAPHLVTPEWVADIWAEEGETSPFWISRVMANFPDEGEDTLIPLKWIEWAQMSDLPATKPVRLGVDVAYMGKDRSVIGARRGYHYRRLREFRGCDTQEVAEAVIEEANKHEAEVVNIDLGAMGAGVYDQVRKGTPNVKGIGSRAVGVNFGESAKDERKYVNMKAEIFWNLREMYRNKLVAIDPKDSKLATQLSALKYSITEERGQSPRVLMKKKSETKKLLDGESPDDADAQALAFAETRDRANRYAAFVRAQG